ncbi:Yip1-domain-containing protein [Rhizoclosmatium globosum]|uniref:Protein YIP n=1 Tax=Rhizoclosmatium globosum TaxID=329046 RepID=A0A1Y2CY66_9FUNG|nr:Yip1-domain-containing protein [Rhizoclosmatium globosum]|eukprot:ORY51960.1 Yip1-domain-containing protein [Rhizoclosmatium globosum]
MSKQYEQLLDMDEPHLDTAQSQLEFQNFVLNSAEANLVAGQVGGGGGGGNGSSSGSGRASATTAGTSSMGANNITQTKVSASEFMQPQQPMTNNTSTNAFWTLQFYAQFFDVDSTDVAQRIIAAVIPRGGFMDSIASNPDLYGPFWIPTTVIFALFVTSFIAGSINAYFSNTSADYVYDMALLSFASTAVYSYVGGTSAALWGIGRYFGCPVKILEVVGLVGYGMSIWVPVSLLCILPSDILRTVLVLVAFVLTSFLFVQNISPFYNNASNPAGRTVALSVILIANAALALAFRFGFFAFVHKVNAPGDNKPVKPTPTVGGSNSSSFAAHEVPKDLATAIATSVFNEFANQIMDSVEEAITTSV